MVKILQSSNLRITEIFHMVWELKSISEEQIQRVQKYLRLTGYEKQHLTKRNLIFYSRIIEAFDNSVEKAAKRYNAAIEKADLAMDKVYEDMLAHIKKPTKEHFYDHFETLEEAFKYKQKVIDSADEAFNKTMDVEFYDIFALYHDKQLSTPQTLN